MWEHIGSYVLAWMNPVRVRFSHSSAPKYLGGPLSASTGFNSVGSNIAEFSGTPTSFYAPSYLQNMTLSTPALTRPCSDCQEKWYKSNEDSRWNRLKKVVYSGFIMKNTHVLCWIKYFYVDKAPSNYIWLSLVQYFTCSLCPLILCQRESTPCYMFYIQGLGAYAKCPGWDKS